MASHAFKTIFSQHDQILGQSDEPLLTTYVSPVSDIHNLTEIQKGKTRLYDEYKYRDEEEFVQLNWLGVCQGKAHQVNCFGLFDIAVDFITKTVPEVSSNF